MIDSGEEPLFVVAEQQQREQTINHSMATSAFSYHSSYQQLHHYFRTFQATQINMQQLHASPALKLKKYKEAVYYGQFEGGKRHGKGIMQYQSGQVYEGDWQMDVRHGHGYERFANGCTYEGYYEMNRMNGVGKYEWPNGQVYQGEWKDNMKEGSGMWRNQQGDSYVGEWKDGVAQGFGLFIQGKGSRYEGDFVNFVKQGKGTQKFVSGDLYNGDYVKGRFQGFGEYYWKDGSFYKGSFSNGVRSGHGVWKRSESKHCDKYEGQFENNKKQGYGIYSWQAGHIYKGKYHNNLRHGYGEMFWSDNSFYKGQWENDLQHGNGQLFTGEEHLKGTFKEGELVKRDEQGPLGINQFATAHTDSLTSSQSPYPYDTMPQNLKVQREPAVSDFYTVDYARPVAYRGKKKNSSPLVPQSFLRKQLRQSITHNARSPQQSPKDKKKSQDHSRSRTPHSAFEIHKLHRNRMRSGGATAQTSSLTTSDHKVSFAFRKGESTVSRHRYLSRLP